MRLAILDFCNPDPVFDKRGSIAEQTLAWIAPELPEAVFTSIHIAGGAAFPDPEDFNGFILTGSEKGVYDETPWMAPLRAFLIDAREARRPLFGICFGHQIMADTFGGKAVKASTGFEIGVRTYQLNGDGAPGTLSGHVAHQDQVVEVPPDAEVIATASYCPVAALRYAFPAQSIQFHPEYAADLIADAIEDFDGKYLTSEEAERGRVSMRSANVPKDLYAKETATFFRMHWNKDRSAYSVSGNT